MERLIELIMNNIVFIVIILGVLSSFISKARRPASGMPPFGAPEGRSERAPAEARESTPVRREPLQAAPLQQLSRPFEAPVHSEGREQPVRHSVKPSLPVPTISDQSSPIYQLQLDADIGRKALEGMVWAEVLGPPRAKRGTRR